MTLQEFKLKDILYKLQEKDRKLQILHIKGRWNTLINGVLGTS